MMAKGQKRSNREIRKPKKEMKPEVVQNISGFKVKAAVGASGFAKKPKG